MCSLFCWFALTSLAAAAEPPKSPANEPDFTAMSLEELGAIKVPTVVGASRFAQKTTEAPASVSIITQDDFKVYGY